MQIITGKYKGRKLVSQPSFETKPTLARVKESLFCVIADEVEGKVVLDLFAGSGALGIDCLSRGAKKVYFCDSSKDAIKYLKTNLRNINDGFEIVESDYYDALMRLKTKFDLVFLDPPYDSDYGEKAVLLLSKMNMLNENALIVFEHSSKKSLQSLPKNCIMEKSKVYGSVAIDFIRFRSV